VVKESLFTKWTQMYLLVEKIPSGRITMATGLCKFFPTERNTVADLDRLRQCHYIGCQCAAS